MHELFNMLERHGLRRIEDLGLIFDQPERNIEALYRRVYNFILKAQKERSWDDKPNNTPDDAFRFVAGASIRGASGCSELGCRIRKFDYLGRYAALYSTEVTLPLSMPAPEKMDSVGAMRYPLATDILTLLYFRPLVTGGIIIPAVMRTQHCIHEAEWVAKMTKFVHEFSRHAADSLTSDFKLTYQIPEKSPSGKATLYIQGRDDYIDDYIEHGELISIFNAPAKWISKTARFDRSGKTEVRGTHKRHILRQIFSNTAESVTFYLAYRMRRHSRFLSDMRGETEFLDWLTNDEDTTATSVALRELQHCVPLLSELPISTIVRIRKEERDSFEAYRSTVSQIASQIFSDRGKISKKQAREMFRTAIEPQIHRMNGEVLSHRKSQQRRVFGGLGSATAAVLIGAYSGLPPLVSAAIVGTASMIGGRLLSKAAESSCEHGPEIKQKNDLYFLLRLTNEA